MSLYSVLPALGANCRVFSEAGKTTQLTAYYEASRRIAWVMMHPSPRPSFNPELLADLQTIIDAVYGQQTVPVDFFITGCTQPQMYNTGGDLSVFAKAIRRQDRAMLSHYAAACVNLLYPVWSGNGSNVISVSMVEGTALGGGFECALAHQYVLATGDAQMGFPEIAFNLFPGMGAYSFVSRKSGDALARELISSGKPRSGAWCAERNLVDRLLPAGRAIEATREFVDELRPKLNGIRAMYKARQIANPLTHAELTEITRVWVEAALTIEEKDLVYMEKLVLLQDRRARRAA